MLRTVGVCVVYTGRSSLFNRNANIAFMVLNIKHKFISDLHLERLIKNNCSLFPM